MFGNRGTHLKHGQHGDGKRVEVGGWCSIWKVECASKELHSQEGKDQNEKKQKQKQRDDGLHGAQQRDHQVSQGRPISGKSEAKCLINDKMEGASKGSSASYA